MGHSALLIGNITHARKEWEELGSLIELKVGEHSVTIRTDNRSLASTGVQNRLKR